MLNKKIFKKGDKKMKHKYLLLTIILFAFLFLFPTTSLALIPGDFGSADNGPPDGVVDFEDLMLFAMTYGSTEGDANWNEVCDIASQGGVLQPDGVIDFEDLMIFAMNYGKRDAVANVRAITVISNTEKSNFQDRIDKDLENKEGFSGDYKSIESKTKTGTHYHIYVHWSTYSEANTYKVYRKVNEGDFIEVFDGYPPPSSNWPGWDGHGWYDLDVQDGNTYSYYVIAYGTGWQTEPSEIATRYTWLPPCSLSSPSDGAIITTLEPTFSWNPVGLETSDFPYGDICYGTTNLWMFDESTDEEVWWSSFDGMTASTATYNYDGNATPLVLGHSYRWCTLGHGDDENNRMIASSDSEWREFIYVGSEEAIISQVNAYTVTYHPDRAKSFIEATKLESGCIPGSTYYFNEPQGTKEGDTEYGMRIYWSAYLAASGCGYKVYKSVDGLPPTVVFSQEAPSGYDWYRWWDEDVSPGSTYSYYVTAYGGFGETLPSQTVTRETWLPPSSAISPVHNSIITDPNPVFTWNSTGITTPYEDIDFGETILRVWDETSGDDEPIWELELDGLTVSTVTYNQDGEAPPLIPGHLYSWNTGAHGYDEDLMAISWTENWQFNYGNLVCGLHATAKTYEYEGNIEYQIKLRWNSYPEASDYHLYRRIGQGVFSEIQGEIYEDDGEMEFRDENVDGVSTYSYYVTADTTSGETSPSLIVTIDTFLPPCYCTTPSHESVVTNPTPTLEWINMDIDNFPYGPLYFADNNIRVEDESTGEEVWELKIEDFNVSSAVYNQDGEAVPLIPGHTYEFSICADCEDESGDEIANSVSWSRFYYGSLVPNICCRAITCSSGEHQIEIGWGHYPEATDYHIYKSINSGGYTEIFGYYEENEDGHWFIDNDVIDENTYRYYITADTPTGETAPSYTDTIDTWLPLCSLSSPTDEAIVTTSEPTFSWNTIGLETSDFPYGSIFYAESHLRVRDESSGNERVWNIDLDDCTTSTVNYNQDGQATPLVIGHRYNWYYYCSGHSEEGESIAESFGENWQFIYTGGAPAVISEVNAFTQIGNDLAQSSGLIEYLIEADLIPFFYQLNKDEISRSKEVYRHINIQWTAYLEESNCGYKVYKSTDGVTFTEVFSQEAPSGYDWYGWGDEDVQEGNTYSYYVTAYGDTWETEPSETVTRETWLPISYLESPIDGATINDSEPTFTWLPVGIADYPYEGTIYSGHTILRVYEDPAYNGDIWSTHSGDLTTSTFIYNQDGQAPSLISGEYYEWNVIGHGVDQEGELAAVSVAGNWGFTYIEN